MLTTAGKTFLTTGAKPVRLGPSLASASFNVAGGFSLQARLAAARPRPPSPNARATARTAVFGRIQIFCVFIEPSLSPSGPSCGPICIDAGVGRVFVTGSRYSGAGDWVWLGNDALADGVENQLGDSAQVQLLHDVGAVGFDGIDAEIEQGGDFLARLALGDELQDLPFAGGEQLVGIFGSGALQGAHVVLEQHLAHGRAEEGFAFGGGANGTGQVGLGGVLQKVRAGVVT